MAGLVTFLLADAALSLQLGRANKMNRIGIIGGLGPETTVEYYRRIIALYRRRNPDGSAPYIIINSLDMKKVLNMLTASKLEELATFLSEEVEKLARAGAQILPASPGFYHRPQTIESLVDHLVFRILDQFAIPHSTATRWKGE